MDALVIALTGTRTELSFGHGCSGERMLGMDALVTAVTATRTQLWFAHGCSGEPMLVTYSSIVGFCPYTRRDVGSEG